MPAVADPARVSMIKRRGLAFVLLCGPKIINEGLRRPCIVVLASKNHRIRPRKRWRTRLGGTWPYNVFRAVAFFGSYYGSRLHTYCSTLLKSETHGITPRRLHSSLSIILPFIKALMFPGARNRPAVREHSTFGHFNPFYDSEEHGASESTSGRIPCEYDPLPDIEWLNMSADQALQGLFVQNH